MAKFGRYLYSLVDHILETTKSHCNQKRLVVLLQIKFHRTKNWHLLGMDSLINRFFAVALESPRKHVKKKKKNIPREKHSNFIIS